jgi:hypothetical protein
MSTFKKTTFRYFAAKLVKMGAIIRHGPHHDAVKYKIARREVFDAAFSLGSSSLAEWMPITCPVYQKKTKIVKWPIDAIVLETPWNNSSYFAYHWWQSLSQQFIRWSQLRRLGMRNILVYNGGKHNKWQPLFLNKYAWASNGFSMLTYSIVPSSALTTLLWSFSYPSLYLKNINLCMPYIHKEWMLDTPN